MKTILIVDDNKVNLATARTILSNEYKVIPVMRGQQAITYLETGECDIILLDIKMPEMDGFEVLKLIREMGRCRNIPVIFLTADNDAATEIRCFKEGAVDFIAKPFVPEVLLSRISRILEIEDLRRNLADKLAQKTQEVSDIKSKYQQDALTGLWDRVYTEEAVNRLLEYKTSGALMMFDLDNFKTINDTYGHITGDKVLNTFADTLRSLSSEEDILCRIGGDEFIVFLKDTDSKITASKYAANVIAQFRDKMDADRFDSENSVSIGIAMAPDCGTEFTKLYNSADKALYYVKRNGKNAYHFFGDVFWDEANRNNEIVDLKYLQELAIRSDSDKGAYLLGWDYFYYVYNFICRFVDHTNRNIATMLFTIGGDESEIEKSMELLEKTANTVLSHSDIMTRYSTRQLVVVLTDSDSESSNAAAKSIVENFNNSYAGGTVRVNYSIARVERH